jgi:hypothetical protein
MIEQTKEGKSPTRSIKLLKERRKKSRNLQTHDEFIKSSEV